MRLADQTNGIIGDNEKITRQIVDLQNQNLELIRQEIEPCKAIVESAQSFVIQQQQALQDQLTPLEEINKKYNEQLMTLDKSRIELEKRIKLSNDDSMVLDGLQVQYENIVVEQ